VTAAPQAFENKCSGSFLFIAYVGEPVMLNRTFIRRVRLLRGREEVITFRYTLDPDHRLVEHVTMQVPESFDAATLAPGPYKEPSAPST